MINKIFSPFYWIDKVEEHEFIKQSLIYKIRDNYFSSPNNASDWDVHTSYTTIPLKNPIDWSDMIPIYEKYINKFILEFFGQQKDFNLSGNPWYTTYGLGQNANTHEHLPDQFSVVHFLSFNEGLHSPITFVNPNNHFIKSHISYNKTLGSMINFRNLNQSYFHPRYTPDIKEGDIIIFPGQIEHLVEKNTSVELRTTVAMNFNIF
jgi:hypothetical protein